MIGLSFRLGIPAGELLARTSSLELAEYLVFLDREDQMQKLIGEDLSPAAAAEAVWGDTD